MRRRYVFGLLVLFALLGVALWVFSGSDPGLGSERREVSRVQPQVEAPPSTPSTLKRDAVADVSDVPTDATTDPAEQARLDRQLFPRLEDSEWGIEGRVRDEKGVALSGVRISAMPYDLPVTSTTYGESDAQGFYRVGLPQDGYYRVTAELFPKSSQTQEQILAGSANVDFELGGRGRIEGKVLDGGSRKPVTSFQIGFVRGQLSTIPGGGFQFSGQGDSEGRFRLENVEAGDTSIFVRATGYVDAIGIVNDVLPGDTVRGVEIQLEQSHGVVGVVVDETGAPVSDAEVVVYEADGVMYDTSPRSRSDERGRFTVEGLAAGAYIVNGYLEGYASGEVETTLPSAETVTVVLSSGGSVEGHVRMGEAPVERARIFVSSDTNGRDLVGETDAGGFYRIDGVPPGTITVRASLGTHPNTRSRSVESQVLTGGTAVADIEFPRADASLEGNIYGANMEPAEVAVSLLVTASGHVERYGISRAPGVYAFTSLPAGAATLEARREGSVLKRIGVELVAGQALVQDIYLDTGYEISCAFSTSGFEFDEIWALVIPGEVPAPAMNQEQLSLLRGSALATAKSLEGENVVLGGLEPGTYTVFSWAQPAGFHFAPRDTWPELIANAPSALAVVTLEAGNEQRTVELALQ